jgi:DNA (cytosine-5)-methyltransferase 1
MNELSLFTGVGGGLLGTMLLGWQCVGAVEFADYPVRVLEARQNDGHLEKFPIWHMDIREFNERIAPMYRGVVDVVSAGFPCQPFSVAGQQRGADDPRNMWPATIECIRLVRPRFCFLENVPGLLNSGYFGTILGDLAESGYDARWRILSAAELGAPHKRDRLWIVGHTQHNGFPAVEKLRGDEKTGDQWGKEEQKETGESEGANRPPDVPGVHRSAYGSKQDVADAISQQPSWRHNWPERRQRGASQPGEEGWPGNDAANEWWQAEPNVGRVAHGVAARVDRLKALGNGQVPAVVATAWLLLTAETTMEAS